MAETFESPEDIGTSPEKIARRWKLELKLSDKRESGWRQTAKQIYKMYTPENPAASSFNILWTNTETLRQSVYNSLPQPDCRRRYQDEDPLGKAVSEVMTRSLEFCQDTYDFDGVLKGDVLSMLLAGRGLSRVRYVPDIRNMGGEDSAEDKEQDAQESESYEEIAWEQVICERVQWDDFRILGPAKVWDDVPAIAFRHRFNREDLTEKFGKEIGDAVTLDAVDDEDVKNSSDIASLFKTAEVWEIWDKEEKKVLFISHSYHLPLKTQDDPLELQGFFPIPRPLYAIENDHSLIPAALYTQYEQQARQLNKISGRINKLTDALKLRGIYDSTLGELSELMRGQDNELIPAQNVTALLERGGLEKAIWILPVEPAAQVLLILGQQLEAAKQVIYEITGISDIMRSASDPNETFGAQRIKTQWGTQRLQRMQREVQRYIRDLIRLKAEIIAEKFQVETLEQMTLVKLPHEQEVQQQMMQWQQQTQQMQMQYQQVAMQAQQQGQQPPPPPQMPPQPPHPITWEQVAKAMKDDATRTYHIDIETDSTLSATQDSDMSGLRDVLTAVTQVMNAFAPAVQAGAMPAEVVKEIMLVICRRAKMGTAVEDVLEKITQPKPPADPNAAKAQADMQTQQAKMQHEMQMTQMDQQHQMQIKQMEMQLTDQQHQRQMALEAQKMQMDAELKASVERDKQQAQAEQNQHQNELEQQREMLTQQSTAALAQQKMQYDQQLAMMQHDKDLTITQMNNEAKIEVAEIGAQTTLQSAQISAAKMTGAE